MTDHQYAYPFDPTGESNDNLIVKESHIISPPDYNDFYFVVPAVGPFFEHNLVVQHWPSGRILVNGVDFVLSYKFLGASRATAKPVYGAISIYDREISGVLEITYQTLGGPWTINEAKAAELLSDAMNNPRITTWEQVVELPHAFPVIDHEWDLVDLVGASDLKDAIDRITDTIVDSGGGGATGDAHVTNRSNPHSVTKAQVGLGSVENYPVASFSEGINPLINNRYVTPQRVAEMIDSYIGNTISVHIGSTENPHSVTATQVGLGNVANYSLANATEALDPLSDNRFVTPKRVHEAIQGVAIGALNTHIADNSNPHKVTKSQVGLDRVENYSVASEAVARDGTSQIHYLTPHGAMQLINEKVGTEVVNHVFDTTNPHNVTKIQVGLGNVPNYAMTDAAAAVAGTSQSLFMSPYHTLLLVDNRISQSSDGVLTIVNDHIGDRTNPHQVTAAQIGLSDVENYGVATDIQAIEGTAFDLYMTPRNTKAAIDSGISNAFTGFVAEDTVRFDGLTRLEYTNLLLGEAETRDAVVEQHVTAVETQSVAHIGDSTNPHSVTKAQVGLGKVENYPIATVVEADAGLSNSVYMTPVRVHEAIAATAGADLTTHVQDTTNPHAVTKLQVGLGNVNDYPMAGLQEATTGTSDVVYMSPLRVRQAIDAVAISALDTHVGDITNPHGVTKTQVGLGSVENYSVATATEATDGLANDRYVTPLRVAEAIDARAVSKLTTHEQRQDNPHQVTKDQVGLGLVQNFAPSTVEAAVAGIVNDSYMTPVRVRAFVENYVTQVEDALSGHVTDVANPHQVTKVQVGLGDVENYPMASSLEASDSLLVTRYMNPATTDLAIKAITGPIETTVGQNATAIAGVESDLTGLSTTTIGHINNTANPHGVTAAQVGAMTVAEVQAGLNGKLGLTAQADDSARLDGKTYADVIGQAEIIMQETLAFERDSLVNVEEFAAATATTVQYQKITEGVFTQARWDDLLLNGDVLASLQLTTIDGATGRTLLQAMTVASDPTTGQWKIRETALLEEVEAIMRLVVDPLTRTMSIWRILRPGDRTVNVETARLASEFTIDGDFTTVVDTLSGTVLVPDQFSIGFAYRLAETIEQEFGLLAQELTAV